jgi:caffeoyl-CoA O-methyltransferase
MSNQTLSLTAPLYDYLLNVSLRDTPLQQELRETTAAHPMARMQIAPEQGQFMELLARMLNTRRAIDIGVFTGYSALAVARALPDEGELFACDTDAETTATAQAYWERAGVAHKVKLRIGPALDTLNQLIAADQAGTFDLAFLDADKTEYRDYYERCLTLLRPGGVILVDNVLWGGSVINPADQSDDTAAIRAFNEFVHGDERVHLSLLPIGDGLTLAMKR